MPANLLATPAANRFASYCGHGRSNSRASAGPTPFTRGYTLYQGIESSPPRFTSATARSSTVRHADGQRAGVDGGWWVGSRGDEGALNLTWDLVDRSTGSLLVGIGSKTKSPGRFIFHAVRVEELLREFRGRNEKWVFADKNGRHLGYAHVLIAFKPLKPQQGSKAHKSSAMTGVGIAVKAPSGGFTL